MTESTFMRTPGAITEMPEVWLETIPEEDQCIHGAVFSLPLENVGSINWIAVDKKGPEGFDTPPDGIPSIAIYRVNGSNPCWIAHSLVLAKGATYRSLARHYPLRTQALLDSLELGGATPPDLRERFIAACDRLEREAEPNFEAIAQAISELGNEVDELGARNN